MHEDDYEPVECEGCVAVHETDHALLVRTIEGDEVWIPLSQIDDDSEVFAEGTEGTLVIPAWLAEDRGLV